MKCGRGHDHESVAEVRACYGVSSEAAPAVRPNKYAGDCVKCHNEVPEGKGRIERNAANKWDVYHLDGECGEIRPEGQKRGGLFPEGFKTIPAGHYATASLTGNNDYDFWRVDRPESGPSAGRIFVKRVIGGRPEAPVRGATRYGALEAILREGIVVCGTRYGVELGQCRICNRELTDDLSRALGIGPVCRNK